MSEEHLTEETPETERPRPPRRSTAEVSEEAREEILRLHAVQYGTRQIATRVGLSRKVVRRVLRESGHASAGPSGPTRSARASKLEPFRERIRELVAKGLTTTRILREIRGPDASTGYRGGRTILAEHVHALRASQRPEKRAKRRFETRMGRELQIDWSPYLVRIGGVATRVHCLGCLLCWSRRLFIHFFPDERRPTLLEGLAMAFDYFEGCAARTVLDNMSTAVLGRPRPPPAEPLWDPRFLDFIWGHYGSRPFACRVKDPDRKGKKEKSFRLVEDDFLKGSEFTSWDDLNARARVWLDDTPGVANNRVHGTTRLVPNEAWRVERESLIRLPQDRFAVYDLEARLVDDDSTLSIAGTRYTVPDELAGRAVSVRLYAFHFEVLDRAGKVVMSRRYVEPRDKGKLIIDPTHYTPRRPASRDGSGDRLEERLLRRFPALEPFVAGVKLRMKALAAVHFSILFRLLARYGEAPFLAAVERALQYRRFDAGAVRRILERSHPLPEGDLEITPLGTAAGTALLGEVEPPSFDDYGSIDGAPPAASPDDERDGEERGEEGETHGA
ncbi:MAG: IS21 family transposase [Candidatus Binatia bacterium]